MEYVELDYEMEMPCLCECGEWFDLNDGFRKFGTNRVICPSCHRAEENSKTTIGQLKRGDKFRDNHDDIYKVTSKYILKRESLIAVDEFGIKREFYYDDNEVILIKQD